jgi:hypothetical protein
MQAMNQESHLFSFGPDTKLQMIPFFDAKTNEPFGCPVRVIISGRVQNDLRFCNEGMLVPYFRRYALLGGLTIGDPLYAVHG